MTKQCSQQCSEPLLQSYLGFVLMAGRAAVLAWEEAKSANPCVPVDHTGTQDDLRRTRCADS